MKRSLRQNKQGLIWVLVEAFLFLLMFAFMYFVINYTLGPVFTTALSWGFTGALATELGIWIYVVGYLGLFALFSLLIWVVTNAKKRPMEE